jgi:hypothetical protein
MHQWRNQEHVFNQDVIQYRQGGISAQVQTDHAGCEINASHDDLVLREVRTDSSKFSLSDGRHIGCKAVGAQYQQARGIDGGSEAETWIPNYR